MFFLTVEIPVLKWGRSLLSDALKFTLSRKLWSLHYFNILTQWYYWKNHVQEMILYNDLMALTLMIRNAMSVNLPQYQPKNKCDTHLTKLSFKNLVKHHGTTKAPLLFRLLKMGFFEIAMFLLMKTSYLCWLFYLLSSTERTTIHGELLSSFWVWSIQKASWKMRIDKGFSCVYNCKILYDIIYQYWKTMGRKPQIM